MSLQIIDVGSIANDNTGEPLRNAFVKVNENFSELYTQVLGTGANLIIAGNALEATNTNGNVELVPNGSGVVKLSNVVVDGAQIRCSPIGTLTLDTTTAINNLNVTGGFSVAGASNLGAVTNITITGGVAGYALTTNGSGTLSWSPAALIAGATGTADRLAYFPTTGSNIADTSANLTWTGNNLLTVTGNISTGNIIAGNLTVGADKIVSANSVITIDPSSSGPGGTVIIEGNLQVTGTTTTVNSTTVEVSDLNLTLAKDAADAAAANGAGITVAGASATLTYANTGDKWVFNKPVEVTGSLTGTTTLSITGNANVGNLGTAGLITATGNITGGNLNTNGVLAVTGNATVGNVSATNANVSAITATGNANVGNLGTVGLITATGNVTGGNLVTGGVLSVTGNATVGNLSATNANVSAITATGNANVGNIGATQGVFTGNITAGNINSVSGILSVTGNANLGNLGAGAGVFTGVVTVTGNLSGGNISTLGVLSVTGNANVGNIGATAAVLAGPLSGVTTINASGNANVGNIGATNSVVTANATFGNINSVSGILNVTGNANVGNIGAGAAVLAGPISGITTLNASGNANVGNLGATNSVVTANATFGNINGVSGILSVTGNANVGNIGAGAAVLAGPLSGVTTINASGNANVGNIGADRGVFTSMVGNLETTAQPNITVVGTLTGLTVSGNFNAQANVFVTSNITAGNINSVSGILSVTGNANVGNLGATAAVLAGPLSGVTTINASGNANVGNLGAAAGVFTSNVSAGNVSITSNVSAGNISTTGNASAGNISVSGLVTTTGNIVGANITSNGNISTSNLAVTNLSDLGNVGNVRITGGSTDYVLRTDGAGNLSWIAAPVISGSVATGTGSRLAYYATTGQTVSDTGANLTWNGSNLLTVTGTITADNLTGNITTGAQPNITSVGTLTSLTVTGNASAGNLNTTGLLSVSGNANVGNLGATNIVGTIATNAQPNITSVGNLVALNAGLTNITASTDSTSTTSGALVVAGGVGIGGNLHVGAADKAHIITGNVTITGNITVSGNQNIIGSNNISYTDNILELHNQANSAPWTTDDGKDVGIRVHYYKGADKHAFFGWSNDAQSLEYYYDGTESGGVFSGSYGTFKGNVFHSTVTTGTAPFTINSTTQVANLHAALAGSVTGNTQANITAVGTLTSLSVTGNANVGNLGATRGVFTNISGTIESGSASQTNITAVGTLGSLTVSGNTFLATSSGNVGIGTSSPRSILNTNVGTITGPAVTPGLMLTSFYSGVTAVNSIDWNYSGQSTSPVRLGATFNSDGAGMEMAFYTSTSYTANGSERVRINKDGNVGIGNTAPTHTLRVEGTISATGNANVGNIGATNGVFTNVSGTLSNTLTLATSGTGLSGSTTYNNSGAATFTVTSNATSANTASAIVARDASGNFSAGTITATLSGSATTAGTVTTAAQGNITSVGTLTSLTVSGNISIGSLGVAIDSSKNFYPGNQTTRYIGFDGTGMGTYNSYFFVGGSYTFYSTGTTVLRGPVLNDIATYLQINGGTSGHTYFNGNVGIFKSSPKAKLDVSNYVIHQYTYTSKTFTGGSWYRFITFDGTNTGDEVRIILRNGGGHDSVEITFSKHTVGNSNLGYVAEVKRKGSFAYTHNITKIRVCDNGINLATSLEVQFGANHTNTMEMSMEGYCSQAFTINDMTAGAAGSSTTKELFVSDGINGTNNQTVHGYSLASGDLFYILGNGNVGIGTSSPAARLQSAGATLTATPTGGSATGTGLYINGTDTTYGMMFGISSDGGGWIQQQRSDANNTQYVLRLNPLGGFVGINLGASNPSTALHVSGTVTATTFSGSGASLTSIPNSATTATSANTASAIVARDASGNFSAGTITATLSGYASGAKFSNDSETKDDISTRTESGFYQTSTATTGEGWPVTSNNWYHLISCTHDNDSNYYSMQLAASFFANELYVRSTNNNGLGAWSTVLLSTNYTSYVGNGTLTLAVSGTGLSGSASFTANQSGNTTFTVTSNATSANTGGAIVARDANGDFNGRYINASYFNSSDDVSTGTLTYLMGKFGDNYFRSATAAKVATFISGQTMNISGTATNITAYTINQNVGTSNNVQFNSLGVGTAGSGTAGEIRATNNITAYYSDQRLKQNIALITDPLEKVSKISGVTFIQNSLAEIFGYHDYSQQVGVIAQEIQAVLPEAVTQAPFDIAEDGTSKSGENYLTVRYEKLVPLLIEAIKELSAKVKELENK